MNVLTEYRIKPAQVDEQLQAIQTFAAALKAYNNPDIKFTAYQLQDKVSFRHVTYIKDAAVAEQLMAQAFYRELGEGTVQRCEQQPTFTPMDMVATFKIG